MRLVRPAIVAALVLTVSWALTPLAVHVTTSQWIPAADRVHWADLAAPAATATMFGLYLITSALFGRRKDSPVGSLAEGSRSNRPGTDAAGVAVSPPSTTPAATPGGAA